MASSFRRGTEAIEQAVEKKPRKRSFSPHIRWDGKTNEEKFVQFLMPMEEIPTVLMHKFVIVGYYEDTGNPIFETFISRRDPGLDGPQGYDELMDRFSLNPQERSIALAAEMKPVYNTTGARKKIEGFELAWREYTDAEEEVQQVPVIGLVEESPRTFYTHLAANADLQPIEEVVWKVKRTGGDQNTTYTFISTNVPALDLSEELDDFDFDFDAYLEELSDEQRMKDIIGALPDSHKISKYGGKVKAVNDRKPSGSTRQRREPVEEAEETTDEEPVSTEPGQKSRRRFEDLKAKAKA